MVKLLIANNEKLYCRLLSQVLMSNFTIEIHCEENGKAALSYLKSNPVDILITDIIKPDIKGVELIKSVRKTRNLHIIAVSDDSSSDIWFLKNAEMIEAERVCEKKDFLCIVRYIRSIDWVLPN